MVRWGGNFFLALRHGSPKIGNRTSLESTCRKIAHVAKRASWPRHHYNYAESKFSLAERENFLGLLYTGRRTASVVRFRDQDAEPRKSELQPDQPDAEMFFHRICRREVCGVGCPKKNKSLNFVSQLTPLIFIG